MFILCKKNGVTNPISFNSYSIYYTIVMILQ
nr:MAG TPA: hypothetical protein [Caudoviricetes sp.]